MEEIYEAAINKANRISKRRKQEQESRDQETALDDEKMKVKISKDDHRAVADNATDDDSMTRTPTNSDKSRQSTTGQEEGDSDSDLEQKDGVDSKLPKMTKITNSLMGLADAYSGDRGATG